MLMAIAVWDTPENNRSWMTEATLKSFAETVDWSRHRLVLSDNGSCNATHVVYEKMKDRLPFEIIYNGKNLGTAAAINKVWKLREPGECALKADNDVTVSQPHWADWMEDVFQRDETIGICGLKRKDLEECPWHTNPWYKSTLRMLPHERGQRWIAVEEVAHVMGTCQAYSSTLLDKIGYLYQGDNLYSFDDSLAAIRAKVAGFKSVFLCNVDIDHIDPGGDDYTEWKRDYAGKAMTWYHQTKNEYLSGSRPVYYGGGFE